MTDHDENMNNRFFRFDPTINSGHIVQAVLFVFAVAVAWTTLQHDVSDLAEKEKKLEAQRDKDQDHWEDELKNSQTLVEKNRTALHDEIKDMRNTVDRGFDRLEDKLDRNQIRSPNDRPPLP